MFRALRSEFSVFGDWLLASGFLSPFQRAASSQKPEADYSVNPVLQLVYVSSNISSNHFKESPSVILSLLATAGENTAKVPVALAQQISSSL